MDSDEHSRQQHQFVSLDLPETMPTTTTTASNQLDFLPTNYDYNTTLTGGESKLPGDSTSGLNYNSQNFNMGFIGKNNMISLKTVL